MNDETYRRIVWSAVLLVGVTVWAFAIIGARSVIEDRPGFNLWHAANTAVTR